MEKSLKSFDFDTLLVRVSSYAFTEKAKRSVLSIRPFISEKEIELRLSLIEKGLELKRKGDNPPLCNIDEYLSPINKLHVEGTYLTPEEILSVREGLSILTDFARYVDRMSNELKNYLGSTSVFSGIISKIDEALTPSGQIKDSASEELARIRREKNYLRNKIISVLQSYFPEEKSFDAIRDEYITLRNGRFVIPVKSERGSTIKGIIHDRSKSGKTYYLEPFEVIELNNKYRELMKDEEEEVLKILHNLSDLVRNALDDIHSSLEAYYKMDFLWALVEFSWEIDGKKPIFTKDVFFHIKGGFNPLLFYELGKDNIVPFDLHISKDKTGVIVSGPNGGGKTIFLKSLGLIVALSRSGLFVPSLCEPRLYPFKGLFSYIADEQNISDSLSTYTAFLSRIKSIFETPIDDWLILVDELGEGTDVGEGSSLGIAILEEVEKRGGFFVVSTHQLPIKSYGEEKRSVVSLSFLYDEETKKPSFKLFQGIPGNSRAIDVAGSVGIPESVIKRAKSLLPDIYRIGEGLLKRLEKKVLLLSSLEERLLNILQSAERFLDDLRRLYSKAESIRGRVREKAYQEVKPLIKEAKRILKDARSKDVKKELKELEEKVDSISPPVLKPSKETDEIKPGDTVSLSGFKKDFQVVSVDIGRNRAVVESGGLRMEVPINMLTKVQGRQFISSKRISIHVDGVQENAIRVIGRSREDAIIDIERFIDKALVQGWKEIKVIHGIGTGRLREGIWDYFGKHPLVKRLRRDENPGVTIIEVTS